MLNPNPSDAALRDAEARCESADVEEACKGADLYMDALEEFDAAGEPQTLNPPFPKP